MVEKWNTGYKKRSAAGGLISDLPSVSKKISSFLTHYSNPPKADLRHSSIPSFHSICLRSASGGFMLTWPSFLPVGPTARREDQVFDDRVKFGNMVNIINMAKKSVAVQPVIIPILSYLMDGEKLPDLRTKG
jgi:hypothetical protein